jgi:hypothetical protein
MRCATCPKCGHVSGADDSTAPERCPACGIYFAKWAAREALMEHVPQTLSERALEDEEGWMAALRARITHVPEQFDPAWFYARAVILTLLSVWGIRLARLDYRVGEMAESFMHNIILPFHEAGHVLFMPFGEFMHMLGGSLFQVLMPLIVAGAFLWKNRDPFGAAIGVWWCGVAFIDLAPYVFDAKNPQLVLLGGQTGEDGPHDWIYILGTFGKISQSPFYGALTHKLGIVIMLAGIAAATVVLWRTWKLRSETVPAI